MILSFTRESIHNHKFLKRIASRIHIQWFPTFFKLTMNDEICILNICRIRTYLLQDQNYNINIENQFRMGLDENLLFIQAVKIAV